MQITVHSIKDITPALAIGRHFYLTHDEVALFFNDMQPLEKRPNHIPEWSRVVRKTPTDEFLSETSVLMRELFGRESIEAIGIIETKPRWGMIKPHDEINQLRDIIARSVSFERLGVGSTDNYHCFAHWSVVHMIHSVKCFA